MIDILWLLLALLALMAVISIALPARRLINQLDSSHTRTKSVAKLFILCTILLIPSSAFYYYFKLGSSKQLKTWYAMQENQTAVKQLLTELKTPDAVVAKMRAYLDQHPADARGWFLLGRLYFSAQQFQNAENAFAKTYQLTPDNIENMLQYAEADFFANQQQLTPLGNDLLQHVLKREPNNAMAMTFLAMNNYRQGNYQNAINLWEKLLAQTPPDSPDHQIILTAIARAEKAMVKQK